MTIKELELFKKEHKIILPLFQSKKYFAAVAEELGEEEKLLYFAAAKDGKVEGTLMITDKRVTFIKRNALKGNNVVNFLRDQITGVDKKGGLAAGELNVSDASGNATYSMNSIDCDKIEKIILNRK